MPYHPFRHIGLKIVSILLAVMLWLTVAREPVVERAVRVPLQFQNIPEQLEIVGEPPATADVRVRGSSGLVSRLGPGELVAVLDLKGARPGTRLFHLVPENVRVPFGVEVEQVLPATVSLDFERSGSRVVPIVPAVEGQPAPGFVIGPVSADPATVEVVGPESHLNQLTEATTEPVSVEGAETSVRDVVTVGLEDAALRLREARTATVTVSVRPAPVQRTLQQVPVAVKNLAARLRIELVPSTVEADLRGSREAVRDVTPETVAAFVDAAGLGPGRYRLPVRSEPPAEIGLTRVEPAEIQVRIK
jgi:YbbR domain-containing protein